MTNVAQLPLATSLAGVVVYGGQNGNDVGVPGSILASGIPNLLPTVGTVAALPLASSFQGYVAITTDQGLWESNGVSWFPIGSTAALPILPGPAVPFASLPPPVANPNIYAATTDQGAVYSNGAAWLPLYNPTNATVGIANNSPLATAQSGTPFTVTFVATQATGPGTWTVNSKFGSSNNPTFATPSIGVMTMTPSSTGTDTYSIQFNDPSGVQIQKLFSIVIQAGALTPAATPTFSPAAGTFGVAKTITISCSTAGATIYYTTNGSAPSTSSTQVTGGVLISVTSTIQAIAVAAGFTQSAIGSATYTITTSGAVYKFNGTQGDYMVIEQYGIAQGASIANDLAWIQLFQAKPVKGIVQQRQWPDLDQGSSIDNTLSDAQNGTGNFAGFTSEVGNFFNLHQAYNPGAYYGLYVNGLEIWKAAPGVPGCVPNYILNCNGNLTVANTFGSGSSTAYTLYKYTASGIVGKCGFLFYASGSSGAGTYGFVMPMLSDPCVVNCYSNMTQALSNFTLGNSTVYNSGTTYMALGQAVSSGGNFYANISTSNTNNTPASSPTFWKQITNFSSYAGQTLDACSLVFYVGENTETSCIFGAGAVAVGQTSSANACTYQNWYTGYNGIATARKAAFPHTMVGLCQSYLIQGADGVQQPPSTWTTYMANQNAQQGIAYSQADISATTFTAGSSHLQNAAAAYLGLNPAQDYTQAPFNGNLPAFGSFATSYVSVEPAVLQVQELDYGGTATASIINKFISTMGFFKATHRLWSNQDGNFNRTAWGATIQPAIIAGTAVPATRPSNLP